MHFNFLFDFFIHPGIFFRNVLFNLQIVGNSQKILMLSNFDLIPFCYFVWLKYLKSLRLCFWSRICSILVNILNALKRNVHSTAVEESVL